MQWLRSSHKIQRLPPTRSRLRTITGRRSPSFKEWYTGKRPGRHRDLRCTATDSRSYKNIHFFSDYFPLHGKTNTSPEKNLYKITTEWLGDRTRSGDLQYNASFNQAKTSRDRTEEGLADIPGRFVYAKISELIVHLKQQEQLIMKL